MQTSPTGNFAPLGTNDRLTVQQVFDQQNTKGGIDGRPLELSVLDDGSDPNTSVIQFNKLAGDGVVAILAPPQSTAKLALKPVVTEKKIPTVALGAADEQAIPPSPYMWMVAPLSSQVGKACMAFLQQQGKTKLALLTDTKNAYANAVHEAVAAVRRERGRNGVCVCDRSHGVRDDLSRDAGRELCAGRLRGAGGHACVQLALAGCAARARRRNRRPGRGGRGLTRRPGSSSMC